MLPRMSAEALAQKIASLTGAQEEAERDNEDAHGSARWVAAEDARMDRAYNPEKKLLQFGRTEQGVVWYGGAGHCLTFAPTGAGKSVSVVVPNMLSYPGSVVCIDPKGAIPAITQRRRHELNDDVILLDPFNEVSEAMARAKLPDVPLVRSSYNPLDSIDPGSKFAIEDARLMAAGIVPDESDKNRFFSDSARMLLEALILITVLAPNKKQRSMRLLLKTAFQSREETSKLLKDGDFGEAFGGHLRNLGNQALAFSTEAGASVWSTLLRSLIGFDSETMYGIMQHSDIDFRRMKQTPTTVYLVLPALRLETHGAWLRLMLSIIINQISDNTGYEYPVLFLLDECAALKRLEILETAVGLMRGYGMKLWLIFQDLAQLERLYGASWSTFIANSGVRQFFNVNDPKTADFVSNYIGSKTQPVFSRNLQIDGFAGGSFGVTQRPLITPDEVRRFDENGVILLYDGIGPIAAKKLVHYADPDFAGQHDMDPYFRGKAGAAQAPS